MHDAQISRPPRPYQPYPALYEAAHPLVQDDIRPKPVCQENEGLFRNHPVRRFAHDSFKSKKSKSKLDQHECYCNINLRIS